MGSEQLPSIWTMLSNMKKKNKIHIKSVEEWRKHVNYPAGELT